MHKSKVLRILMMPSKHDLAEVERAVMECLSGRHGARLSAIMTGKASAKLREAGGTPEEIKGIVDSMVRRAQDRIGQGT